jgi:alpha-ketoglutarate-dependent 2,4-dichlorophenoxyacetate dioxygenase
MSAPIYSRISTKPLHEHLAAEIHGVDIAGGVDDETFSEIEAAFDEHSVVVFPDQRISNQQLMDFSVRFGELETMLKGFNGKHSYLAYIGNVDPKTNEIIAADDARMQRQFSNELWHTDSSFKPIGARASLLHGREVPPSGGETSFASMRAAYNALSPAAQAELEDLVAEHWFVYSRSLTAKDDFLTDEQKAETPPVPQALVVKNPNNGRKAIYTASHAYRILGWDYDRGRKFLDELQAHATQDQFAYHHAWRPYDLVMWDNRSAQHRGNAFDYKNHRRVMVRSTIVGAAPTISADEVACKVAKAEAQDAA